jgi:hypothetical protein
LLIIAGMLAALLAVYGQNTSVTNNNTVVINAKGAWHFPDSRLFCYISGKNIDGK